MSDPRHAVRAGFEDRVEDWLTSSEAAARLDVKRATLYAYVSRGLLSRKRLESGRASYFSPSEVEAMSRPVFRTSMGAEARS